VTARDFLETSIIKNAPFGAVFRNNLEFLGVIGCSIMNVIFGHDRGYNDQEEAQLCPLTTEVKVFMDKL
jgi:hypothetical protein